MAPCYFLVRALLLWALQRTMVQQIVESNARLTQSTQLFAWVSCVTEDALLDACMIESKAGLCRVSVAFECCRRRDEKYSVVPVQHSFYTYAWMEG